MPDHVFRTQLWERYQRLTLWRFAALVPPSDVPMWERNEETGRLRDPDAVTIFFRQAMPNIARQLQQSRIVNPSLAPIPVGPGDEVLSAATMRLFYLSRLAYDRDAQYVEMMVERIAQRLHSGRREEAAQLAQRHLAALAQAGMAMGGFLYLFGESAQLNMDTPLQRLRPVHEVQYTRAPMESRHPPLLRLAAMFFYYQRYMNRTARDSERLDIGDEQERVMDLLRVPQPGQDRRSAVPFGWAPEQWRRWFEAYQNRTTEEFASHAGLPF